MRKNHGLIIIHEISGKPVYLRIRESSIFLADSDPANYEDGQREIHLGVEALTVLKSLIERVIAREYPRE